MSQSEWQQVRTYADNLGHRVVLEHLVPLDDDHENLRRYLMQSFWDDEVKPLFEIYSYCPPNGFACIEHNRNEIARRKQQDRSGVENPPPLIPRFIRPGNYLTVGFCVLLRSYSYRLGYIEDSDEFAKLGEGPDLLYFNRSFSSTRNNIDEAQRESEDDESLLSEGFELATQRVTDQIYIGQILIIDIFNGVGPSPARYALDIDEGEIPSSDLPSEEQIRDQLSLETSGGGFSLHPEFHVSQDTNIVTVTNTPKGKTPDIQYLVHTLFLSSVRHTAGPSLLESTARLFTASIISNLPANKTLTLKFFIPNSPSLSVIRPAQNVVLEILSRQTQEEDRENSFPIGALHNISTGDDQPPTSKRITPQIPEKHIITGQGRFCERFRLFTVVLDRARFVSEAGVYFYMAYLDGSENPDLSMQDAPDDTQVVRGVDMSTVPGRLGVVVLGG
ncbi:hypothetical protein N7465_002389 [Penicillium sp. CMV-2018d]|nr:hypothetical protein N7465_002389 [Penicillium sp. CMV-2018d]